MPEAVQFSLMDAIRAVVTVMARLNHAQESFVHVINVQNAVQDVC